jgi:hypothetical protein
VSADRAGGRLILVRHVRILLAIAMIAVVGLTSPSWSSPGNGGAGPSVTATPDHGEFRPAFARSRTGAAPLVVDVRVLGCRTALATTADRERDRAGPRES